MQLCSHCICLLPGRCRQTVGHACFVRACCWQRAGGRGPWDLMSRVGPCMLYQACCWQRTGRRGQAGPVLQGCNAQVCLLRCRRVPEYAAPRDQRRPRARARLAALLLRARLRRAGMTGPLVMPSLSLYASFSSTGSSRACAWVLLCRAALGGGFDGACRMLFHAGVAGCMLHVSACVSPGSIKGAHARRWRRRLRWWARTALQPRCSLWFTGATWSPRCSATSSLSGRTPQPHKVTDGSSAKLGSPLRSH